MHAAAGQERQLTARHKAVAHTKSIHVNRFAATRVRLPLSVTRSEDCLVDLAVAAGFDRVFLTILDTHVASLIAAAFLFQFGTGAIRGFATTLTVGLLSNVFTAVFVSRTMFELGLSRRNVTKLSI